MGMGMGIRVQLLSSMSASLPSPQAISVAKEAGILHLDRSDPVKVSCALKIVEHGFTLRN